MRNNGQKSGFLFLLKLFPLSILFLGLCSSLSAQVWQQAKAIKNTTAGVIGGLCNSPDGGHFIAGTFSEPLNLEGTLLTSNGLDDVFLARYDIEGQLLWAKSGGSSNNDFSVSIWADESAVYWVGQYWISAQFEGLELSLDEGSKGIFMLKYDLAGNLLWGQSIAGNNLNVPGEIKTDENGNIFLTGYFQQNLFVGDTTLIADAFQSSFIIKLDSEGQLAWARSGGYEGELNAKRLALAPSGNVLIGGDILGKAVYGGDSIRSFTADYDVFLAAYNSDGQELWGRRAGGGFEDICNGVEIDDAGVIFVAGNFIGVLALNDNIEIQTTGFNKNIFLLRYASDGTPQLARSIGSTEDEEAYDLLINEEQIILTGHYFGNLEIDGFSISGSTQNFNAFVLALDKEANTEWLKKASSSQYIEGRHLAINQQGEIIVGGNFSSNARFGLQYLEGLGLNDIFWSRLNPLLSSTSYPTENTISIFPNPTAGSVYFNKTLQQPTLRLYNSTGQLIFQNTSIDSHWNQSQQSFSLGSQSPGVYFLHLTEGDRHATFRVVKY